MINRYAIYLAWVIALVASVGSLYYSELAHLIPCTLCWYQRSMIFGLVVILGMGAYRRDAGIIPYGMTMAGIGLFIAFYQLLQHYFPGFGVDLCGPNENCSNGTIYYFGFLSIPLMSLVAFAMIGYFLYRAKKSHQLK